MNDKELREKTKHRTFTSMAQRRRWLALNEQIQENRKEEKMEIKVNDKVQWWGFKGDEQTLFAGVVESISEFNGKKTFTVRKFGTFAEDRGQTMISASRVTKLGTDLINPDDLRK